MLGFLKKLFGTVAKETPPGNLGVDELCRRLGMSEQQLRAVPIQYRTFNLPKRTGGTRTITAPADALKKTQRLILHRLLRRLRAHPSATGFERGYSIVSNALPHVGQEVVIKLDIRDFFGTTSAKRVDAYFRMIGWNADAAALLTMLCTHEGSLPQGAPTSSRLSNLVNYALDARLAALTAKWKLSYSRYADDMTFAGPATPRITNVIHAVKEIVADYSYALHTEKKLRIARRGDRQIVTGLVVNGKVNLPRSRRRWLRAVEHHLKVGKPVTLTTQQLAGWRALAAMVKSQATPA
jgi:retron-type reverse transcriptase